MSSLTYPKGVKNSNSNNKNNNRVDRALQS